MLEDKNMERVSVTIPKSLLQELDESCKDQEQTRSEVVRDAIRQYLNKKTFEDVDAYMDGFVIISLNHHQKGLLDDLTDLEHHSKLTIYSTLHVHVGVENCSEVIAVKGKIKDVLEFVKKVKKLRGILLSELIPLYTFTDPSFFEHHHGIGDH